jgi:hypothetical protein
VMPTECQRQSAADQDKQVQHATDRGWRRRRKSTWTSFGECHAPEPRPIHSPDAGRIVAFPKLVACTIAMSDERPDAPRVPRGQIAYLVSL